MKKNKIKTLFLIITFILPIIVFHTSVYANKSENAKKITDYTVVGNYEFLVNHRIYQTNTYRGDPIAYLDTNVFVYQLVDSGGDSNGYDWLLFIIKVYGKVWHNNHEATIVKFKIIGDANYYDTAYLIGLGPISTSSGGNLVEGGVAIEPGSLRHIGAKIEYSIDDISITDDVKWNQQKFSIRFDIGGARALSSVTLYAFYLVRVPEDSYDGKYKMKLSISMEYKYKVHEWWCLFDSWPHATIAFDYEKVINIQ